MSEFINLTHADIQNIIIAANQAGRNGEYIYGVVIIKPTSAAQGANSSIVVDARCLRSASESEPIPCVYQI